MSASATGEQRVSNSPIAGRTEHIAHGGTEGYLCRKCELGLFILETDHKHPWAVLGKSEITGTYNAVVE